MPKPIDTKLPAGTGADDVAAGSREATGRPASQAHPDRKPAFVELTHPDVWVRVRKLALRHLDRVLALEPKVLRGESTSPVHDLRVACRRLQALLDFLYAPPLPAEVRKIRRKLRKARQALGELRNFDALADRIERALARKRTAHRAAWEAGHDYALKQRRKSAERAHRKLTRLNLGDVYLRLRHELTAKLGAALPPPAAPPRVIAFPEDRAEPAPPAAGEELAGRFAARLAERWNDFEARSAEALRDHGALHAFRISAKRLRYHIEVAAELEVAGSADALDWLRALQAKLGDWHDHDVLVGMLLEMVARREFLAHHLPLAIEVEKLVLSLRRSKTHATERFLRETLKSAERRRTAEWITQRADSRALATD